ncbi:MAG: hypothetical protein IKN82_03510 [Treponema sp.]|nr:hypothetical protein [Treponema sp.]
MKKNKAFFVPFVLAAALFFTTCGLDTFYIVDPPTTVIHEPVYTSTDFSANYFNFISAIYTGPSSFNFLGTAVYYRIYASASTMLSRQSSISAVNTSGDYSAAALRMIGYGYQQLNTAAGNIQPLISDQGANVYIRLCNYGDENNPSNEYRALIGYIDKTPRRTVSVSGVPKTFDFGRHDNPKYNNPELYALPVSGDEDFESGTVENNKYYVDLYAVAVGRDVTYTTYYSQVLHLGSIPIDASAENN